MTGAKYKTSLPGFDDSLRLLVEREQYSATDIGAMFGVSHQAVTQWCAVRGLSERAYPKGLRAVRVWDDSAHCFRAVRVGAVRQEKKQAVRAVKKSLRTARIEKDRDTLVDLQQRLGRAARTKEMAGVLFPHVVVTSNNAAPLIAGRFGFAKRDYWARFKKYAAENGIEIRPRGSPGHLDE